MQNKRKLKFYTVLILKSKNYKKIGPKKFPLFNNSGYKYIQLPK